MWLIGRILSRSTDVGYTFFVEFSGVERGVVKAADGEGDGVGSCRSEVVS